MAVRVDSISARVEVILPVSKEERIEPSLSIAASTSSSFNDIFSRLEAIVSKTEIKRSKR